MRQLLTASGFNPRLLQLIEAGLIGMFLVQALRFAIAGYYSRIASASLALRIQPEAYDRFADVPGFVVPEVITDEITLLVYTLALPLLAILIGRFPFFLMAASLLTVSGRTLMLADIGVTPTAAAALTAGAGMLYLTLLIRYRPLIFPHVFLLGLTTDQIFRAAGNTADITLTEDFFPIQLGLFLLTVTLTVINYFTDVSRLRRPRATGANTPERGLLTLWGGISVGAMLFLQLSLLALPNAVAGRARVDYTLIVPLLIVATLLPILPSTRTVARQFIGLFDTSVRGWVWMLLIALFLVLGTRFTGIPSAIGFVGAQFVISLLWWWMIRPQAEKERNLSGLWITVGMAVFLLLLMFDIFTYEYAYVQRFAAPLTFLNNTVVPLLRGFRGLGYMVILLAAMLVAMPMIQTQRRIAWRASTYNPQQTTLLILIIAGAAVGGAYLSSPILVPRTPITDSLRIGTYNIHAGYSEFYASSLEQVAQTIEQSGVNVVLLQEVEVGRLTSFSVDQSLWLARRLGMDTRFFPTNEGLQGLAVLSNVEIVFDDGEILAGIGQQTGVQRVQLRPLENTIVTVYNTWLSPLLRTADGQTIETQEQEQQRQLNAIISLISAHHPNRQLGRTVLGGTFNNIPDSPLIQSIDERGFSDPFAGSPIERSATLVRTGARARVDYVWIYPEIAEGVGVIESVASDHRLAFVSLSLREP